jgi:hypothetical protein
MSAGRGPVPAGSRMTAVTSSNRCPSVAGSNTQTPNPEGGTIPWPLTACPYWSATWSTTPELRYIPNGTAVAKSRLAVTPRVKLKFHNGVVDRIEADPHHFGLWRRRPHDAVLFERARQLTRWHYQWLVVHDWLKTVTLSGIVDKILLGGPKHYARRNNQLFMPLEYSVAGFRFGHTMVRDRYDYNRNFGKKDGGPGEVLPTAPFDLLFLFTGNGFQRQGDTTKALRTRSGARGRPCPSTG